MSLALRGDWILIFFGRNENVASLKYEENDMGNIRLTFKCLKGLSITMYRNLIDVFYTAMCEKGAFWFHQSGS